MSRIIVSGSLADITPRPLASCPLYRIADIRRYKWNVGIFPSHPPNYTVTERSSHSGGDVVEILGVELVRLVIRHD